MRFGPVSLVAVALLLASSLGAYQELAAFRVRADVATGTLPSSHSRIAAPGLSSRLARRARLDACSMHLNQLLDLGQSGAQQEVVPQCLALAESIVSRAPLSSNEWLVASQFASDVGDPERVGRYLLRSFETAPAEQWISGRRSMFAYEQAAGLAPEFQALIDRDLLVMLQTESGVRSLAKYYVSDPSLRKRIVDLALTLDQERQLRLLMLIREQVEPTASQSGKTGAQAAP